MRRPGASVLAVCAASALLGACTGGKPEPDPEVVAAEAGGPVIESFVQAWRTRERADLDQVTDAPRQARADMREIREHLQISDTSVRLVDDLECTDDSCEQHARVTHDLDGYGQWRYRTRIVAEPVERPDGEPGPWRVVWTPAILHPDLTPATTFERQRVLAPRAPILDRTGVALTPERDIVRIGVRPDGVRPASYRELVELLDVDAASLRTRVQAAEPDWFVPVIDLRTSDYDPLRRQLLAVPGIVVDPGERALAPTAEWGRAVVGTVGPATAEAYENAGPTAAVTDEVGESGLQYAFQRQLAGEPGIRIRLVEDRPGGPVLNTIYRRPPEPGTPLRTTLDLETQSAAQRAVNSAPAAASVVAVKASTGEILAVANGPDATSYNTAFVGQYAPGSTFKVVSTAALLQHTSVKPSSRVECPDALTVGGKTFTNYDPAITGPSPTFADAFAASCNTTMVGRAAAITGRHLAEAGAQLGLGATWDIGLDAYSGSVPADADLVTRAADMIGQGKVLASPLAMAMVAAAVDSGVSRTPTLLPDEYPGTRQAQLPRRLVTDLSQMMRLTVTDGTAELVDLPGEPVYAKTGTAEYALDGGGTGTNAWIIGFREDVAFAVFLAGGDSGGHDAGALAKTLLENMPEQAGD